MVWLLHWDWEVNGLVASLGLEGEWFGYFIGTGR